ncbi:hypothetical protein I0E51_05840 [Pseudomonas lalucatii]|nr:hypothetical protein [Pseudomonas lalucatii]
MYILFAAMLSEFFLPDLSLWTQIAIGIALALLTALFNAVKLGIGKWLPNLGALMKLVAVLALGIGGIRYGLQHGFANP